MMDLFRVPTNSALKGRQLTLQNLQLKQASDYTFPYME